MCEEKEGVMRNVMTTRAPGGANKYGALDIVWIAKQIPSYL